MEKVQLIIDRLQTTQSRQKFYADLRRREIEFKIYDWVMKFFKKGKLIPRYVVP